ncbi:family 78 glycoside hydrolase catalytic domain [Pectobacterium aquaticum]|uniref:alpha-L-rhamnosidase n=1 Tax=Pectobacterium aquaticum TaxID=2204145 RepID=A0ABX9YXY7_9GAMM|nr:family 78 glycoside hydrolase catalytic domain [Pectobacterium aquaticum]RRO02815.1 hypothetical protein DMB85_019965 [Pectobacterium aquaticum]RRO02846.1 hypothetical protein DMB83_008555 [Pectobacterium aquaticum]
MKIRTSLPLGLLIGLSFTSINAQAVLSVVQESLLTELQRQPLLIEDVKHPAFSWALLGNERNEKQTAYRIIVAKSSNLIDSEGRYSSGKAVVWDSGKVMSDRASAVQYAGPQLDKATRYYWSVQVWDQHDRVTPFAAMSRFDTALKGDWQAKPVWYNSPQWRDYTVEFDLNIVDTAAGFYLRASEAGAYKYQFRLAPDNKSAASLVKFKKTVNGDIPVGKPVLITNQAISLQENTYSHIKIDLKGDTLTTYINGIVVDKTQDSSFGEGAVGIWAEQPDHQFKLKNIAIKTSDNLLYQNTFDGRLGSPFAIPAASIEDNELVVGVAKDSAFYKEFAKADAVMETQPDWVFFRKSFQPKNKPIDRAVLYATGQTPEDTRQYVYKVNVNGKFAGLGPVRGYDNQHFYNAFDVTSLIRQGEENALGALAFTYGKNKSFLAELRIHYQDGDSQIIMTDESWKVTDGTSTFPYVGDVHAAGALSWVGFRYPHENIIAQNYPTGFDSAGFDDQSWNKPRTLPPIDNLTGYPAENLTQVEVKPRNVTQLGKGHFLLDYGTTVVGGMKLSIDNLSSSGNEVTIKTGETLTDAGGVKWQTAALINNLDKWQLKAGAQTLEQFGFRVFRYAEISGLPASIGVETLNAHLSALALRYPFNDNAATFSSSNNTLNDIWAFSKESIKVLNHDLYVDSPNRERAPYEADTYIQQLSNYQLDKGYPLARLSTEWLIDHSTWPMEWKIYNILNAWNDYLYTGDDRLIRDNYERLKGKLPAKLSAGFDEKTGLVTADYGNGAPGPDHDIVDWPASLRAGYQFSDTHNVTNAFFFKGTETLAAMAGVLGKRQDEIHYRQLAESAARGFRSGFYDVHSKAFKDNIGGKMHLSSQANAFGVAFGIATAEQAKNAATFLTGKNKLEGSVYSALFALSTMTENGQGAEAINQITGLNDDGSIRHNSHNWRHMMALGSGSTMEAWNESDDLTVSHSHAWGTAPVVVASQGIFGVKPLKPAYEQFQIKPILNGLTHASIGIPTIRGEIGASFNVVNNIWHLNVSIPANTEAYVYIPAKNIDAVRESDSALKSISNIKYISTQEGYIKVLVGSGNYQFVSESH